MEDTQVTAARTIIPVIPGRAKREPGISPNDFWIPGSPAQWARAPRNDVNCHAFAGPVASMFRSNLSTSSSNSQNARAP